MVETENDVFVDHVSHSIGGFGGHAFRRFTHVSMAVVPYLYYVHGDPISSYFSLTPDQFVSVVALAILLIEFLRIRLGVVIVGQREYESEQISALAWGALAVSLALLIAPREGELMDAGLYGTPIIIGMTIVDPIMGEIKRIKQDLRLAIIVGLLVSYTIWLTSHFWLGTSLAAVVLLAPLTVIGEIPSTRIIDDNATMILLPLAGLMLIYPFL
ncbi:MAG TPA: hypothetical protein QF703_03485 [Candidatus Thalassarchaeaceae archaeon]|jgi:hypothetical protein|nr:hypothetical protein [Candidatus Thalassarchaeaceae archaeon]|tara:strand:+ start:6039 stop:6680 length:642 start_codon:yes stop_codon:yes gene_type:complete